jgi:GT2 family glycosyltransferase
LDIIAIRENVTKNFGTSGIKMLSKRPRDCQLPFASVVIPTLNRKHFLDNCLKSLFEMDYPMSRFEIIVVDNGCTDGTKDMVKRDFPKVKFVVEKRRGVVHARNTGSKYAKGLIIAYTDDDCTVDRDWLRNLVSGFTSGEIGGVGGPVFLSNGLLFKKFWTYRYRSFDLGDRKQFVNVLITGNLAVLREVFIKIKFDETLMFHDSEDVDFCRSLTDAGYSLLYLPSAKVYHNVNFKRLSIQNLLKRAFFAGISLYLVEKKHSNGLLIPEFFRKFLGGVLDFFRGRRITNFYWLVECFIAFVSSLFLFTLRRKRDNATSAKN